MIISEEIKNLSWISMIGSSKVKIAISRLIWPKLASTNKVIKI